MIGGRSDDTVETDTRENLCDDMADVAVLFGESRAAVMKRKSQCRKPGLRLSGKLARRSQEWLMPERLEVLPNGFLQRTHRGPCCISAWVGTGLGSERYACSLETAVNRRCQLAD